MIVINSIRALKDSGCFASRQLVFRLYRPACADWLSGYNLFDRIVNMSESIKIKWRDLDGTHTKIFKTMPRFLKTRYMKEVVITPPYRTLEIDEYTIVEPYDRSV